MDSEQGAIAIPKGLPGILMKIEVTDKERHLIIHELEIGINRLKGMHQQSEDKTFKRYFATQMVELSALKSKIQTFKDKVMEEIAKDRF